MGNLPGKQVKQFRYNLLVNDLGDKALEIEHEESSNDNRVLITVYRPVEDIAQLSDSPPPSAEMPVLALAAQPEPQMPEMNAPEITATIAAELVEEPPLFAQPTNRPRPDFRRLHEAEPGPIHILREETKPQPALDSIMDAGMPPLPSFLTAQEKNYLSLDEVIPPETDRVRCDLRSAKAMIDMAITRNVRVRDIMREMVGLDAALNDEVIFELPLSENDYRQLAMRYRVRPDHRDEIRQRLQKELAERLNGKK
jgi:hypothetical protein